MGPTANLNLHPGLEMVNCYTKYFDCQETQLNSLIDKLSKTNIEIKIISDVMNKLAHVKQKDKKADFNNDEKMKRYIAYIHMSNPTIFDGLIQGIPEHFTNDEPIDGQDIEDVLNERLKYIDMSKVKFDVLTEDQIDVVVQGLDGELKMKSADVNEYMMKINEKYDNRSQMTENANKVLKETSDLLASINRKTGSH